MKMIIVINDGLIINLCLLAVNKKVIFIISMLIRTNKMQKKPPDRRKTQFVYMNFRLIYTTPWTAQ